MCYFKWKSNQGTSKDFETNNEFNHDGNLIFWASLPRCWLGNRKSKSRVTIIPMLWWEMLVLQEMLFGHCAVHDCPRLAFLSESLYLVFRAWLFRIVPTSNLIALRMPCSCSLSRLLTGLHAQEIFLRNYKMGENLLTIFKNKNIWKTNKAKLQSYIVSLCITTRILKMTNAII